MSLLGESQMKIRMNIFIACISPLGCNPSSLNSVKVIDGIWQCNDGNRSCIPFVNHKILSAVV